MIDDVEVKGFNGSQLNGKTISTYSIFLTKVRSEPVRMHIIKTFPASSGTSIIVKSGVGKVENASFEDQPIPFKKVETEKAAIFLNGKLITEEEFKSVDVKDIAHLNVMKGQSAVKYLQKQKEEGKYDGEITEASGVIEVTYKPRK